jgi:hypothetical protein
VDTQKVLDLDLDLEERLIRLRSNFWSEYIREYVKLTLNFFLPDLRISSYRKKYFRPSKQKIADTFGGRDFG